MEEMENALYHSRMRCFVRYAKGGTEFFVTTIKEVPDKNFGIGGKTIDKVKAEYMQTHNKQL